MVQVPKKEETGGAPRFLVISVASRWEAPNALMRLQPHHNEGVLAQLPKTPLWELVVVPRVREGLSRVLQPRCRSPKGTTSFLGDVFGTCACAEPPSRAKQHKVSDMGYSARMQACGGEGVHLCACVDARGHAEGVVLRKVAVAKAQALWPAELVVVRDLRRAQPHPALLGMKDGQGDLGLSI